MVSATTSPPCAARSAVAAPSARTSKELASPGTPSRTSRRVAASKRSADRTGTYFTQTTIRMAAVFHHILPGLRMPRGSKTSFTVLATMPPIVASSALPPGDGGKKSPCARSRRLSAP